MIDWNAEAQSAVDHVQSELSEAHRGAFLWHEPRGVVLVFNQRLDEGSIPEKQLDFVNRAIQAQGGTIRALAHSEDETSWAMLVTDVNPAWAHDCIWAAWHSTCSEMDPEHFAPFDLETFIAHDEIPLNVGGRYQYGLAQKTIEAHYSNPNTWKGCRPDGWVFGEPSGDPE